MGFIFRHFGRFWQVLLVTGIPPKYGGGILVLMNFLESFEGFFAFRDFSELPQGDAEKVIVLRCAGINRDGLQRGIRGLLPSVLGLIRLGQIIIGEVALGIFDQRLVGELDGESRLSLPVVVGAEILIGPWRM